MTGYFSCAICHDTFLGEDLGLLHLAICHRSHFGIENRTILLTRETSGIDAPQEACHYETVAMGLARIAHNCRKRSHGLPEKSYRCLMSWQLSFQNPNSAIQTISRAFAQRTQLLQLSEELGCESDAWLRRALHTDDLRAASVLKDLVCSASAKSEIQNTRGATAEGMLEFIDMILSDNSLWSSSTAAGLTRTGWLAFRRTLVRLNVRLSEDTDRLPQSLYLSDIQLETSGCVAGGAFSDIYRGKWLGKDVALKKFRVFLMQTLDDRVKWSKTFYREILLLRYLCHPNISSLLGVDQNTFNGIPSVVSEWMPHGDIRTYIQNNNPSQRKLSCLAAEIAAGLAYLHKENVVHGDLHGRNILIDEHEHARLIDFGLSNFADSSTESGCSRYGATKWMAPELLCPSQFGLSRVRHTPASDIYSYSCVLWQIFSGSAPFDDMQTHEIIIEVPKGLRPLRSSSLQAIPNQIWDLMEQCWSQDYHIRPEASVIALRLQIYAHEPPKSLARLRMPDIRIPTPGSPTSRASPRPRGPRARSASSCSHTDDARAEADRRIIMTPLQAMRFSPRLWSRRALSRASTVPMPSPISSEFTLTNSVGTGQTVRRLACTFPRGHDVVPQRVYWPPIPVNPGSLQDPVMFYVNNKQGCGIACVDALQGHIDNLDGCKDRISFDRGRITVRVLWPGYIDWSYVRSVRTRGSVEPSLSRSKVAKFLAECTRSFLNDARPDPAEEYINARWKIGFDGIEIHNLELLGMQHVTGQDWQIHFRVRR